MSVSLTLMGGPPWGLRVSHDEELRPVVGKLIPGGRASVAGLRIGDVILEVGGVTITSSGHAHSAIHEARGNMTVLVQRNQQGFHPTVRREKLSHSVHSSPVLDRRAPFSLPSSPQPSRHNSFGEGGPGRVRLDVEGIRGSTESRRRLFESVGRPPATDSLLRTKIQMGVQRGVPSESTTGYDSVCGDFAGGGAASMSGRSSPASSILREESEEVHSEDKTLHEDPAKPFVSNVSKMSDPHQMRLPAPGQSQWVVQTATHNEKPAQGEIEVPRPRGVAALRQAITTKLEMKSPTGAPPRPKTPSQYAQDQDGRSTPSSWKNAITVYEGVDQEREGKAYMGRVLDGPVPADKYFQGVPPPSYNLCNSPAASHSPAPAPFSPPSVPPKPRQDSSQSTSSSTATTATSSDSSQAQTSADNSRVTVTENGQSASDFYHSLYGGGGGGAEGERVTRAIPEQSQLAGKPPPYKPTAVQEREAEPAGALALNAALPSNEYTFSASRSPNEHFMGSEGMGRMDESQDMTASCITTFDDDIQQSQHRISQNGSNGSEYPEDPKSSPKSYERPASMDLETSELLKSKSPAPFSTYSTGNNGHYGSLSRRCHSPVTPVTFSPSDIVPHSAAATTSAPVSVATPIYTPTTLPSPSISSQQLGNSSLDTTSDTGFVDYDQRRPESLLSLSTLDGTAVSAPSDCSQYSHNMTSSVSAPCDSAHYSGHAHNMMSYSPYSYNGPSTHTETTPTSELAPSKPQSVPFTRKDYDRLIGSMADELPSTTTHVQTSNNSGYVNLPYNSAAVMQSNGYSNPSEQSSMAASYCDSDISTVPTIDSSANYTSAPAPAGPAPLHETDLMPTAGDMSSWYKNMFKKMHKLDPLDDSVLRYHTRERSPSASSNISRPLTPSSFVSRPPSRFDCEITPRRARSVGRVVEPARPSRFALERSRTRHFHLPSYSFRHEDPRPLLLDTVCPCRPAHSRPAPSGERCLRCGLPRKDPSWSQIDHLYRTLSGSDVKQSSEDEKTQRVIVHRRISDRLEATASELEHFIQQLDVSWRRSASPPQTNKRVTEKESSPLRIAEEIAELKRLSKEEEMYRQKAERLTEELQQQSSRRHGYVPSATPSLQKNFDRFEGLMKEYTPPAEDRPSSGNMVRTATAVYKFPAKSARELSLNKGDIVRIIREVDQHWLEGERNGATGIFPASYVEMDDDSVERQHLVAVYPFTARNINEMSLKMGEQLTYRRDIDNNWMEGSNHLGEIGIFPKSYVRRQQQQPQEEQQPSATTPLRPKTPLISNVTFDIDYESPPREIKPTSMVETRQVPRQEQSHRPIEERSQVPFESRPAPSASSSSNLNPSDMASLIPRGSETYRALFAYRPEKEDELELLVGDIVFVVEKCDDGWYIGTLLRNGRFGTFPGNYVQRH